MSSSVLENVEDSEGAVLDFVIFEDDREEEGVGRD